MSDPRPTGGQGVSTQALRRFARRPFGRFNAWFYERESASAVAEIVGPVIIERITAHLAAVDPGPDQQIVDIGAGSGRIAAQVAAASGRAVLAVEPSSYGAAQLRASASRLVRPVVGAAESIPAADDSCTAVYSSCTVKHWHDLDDGLREILRVAAPGALVLTVEIDGVDPTEVRAFVRHTRIPNVLDGIYVRTVGRGFVELGPTAAEVADRLGDLGATNVTVDRIAGLPFWVVSAHASS